MDGRDSELGSAARLGFFGARALGRLRQGRGAGAAPADRASPRSSSSRRRRSRSSPTRSGPSGCRPEARAGLRRVAPLDHPLLLRRDGPSARLRPGGGDGHRPRAAQGRPGVVVLAGKALFNFLLFLAIAAVSVPAFVVLLEWRVGSPAALAAVVAPRRAGASRSSRRSSRRSSPAPASATSSSSWSRSRCSCRCSCRPSRRPSRRREGSVAVDAAARPRGIRRRRDLRGAICWPRRRGKIEGRISGIRS